MFKLQIRLLSLILLCTPVLSARSDIFFTENKGQWQSGLDFRADIPNGVFCWWQTSWSYTLFEKKVVAEELNPDNKPEFLTGYTFKVTPLYANKESVKYAKKPLETTFHYFLGNDTRQWKSDVRNFGKITGYHLYKNIHLSFSAHHHTLKYEFEVEKGGNPAQIKLLYEGLENIYLQNNQLYLVAGGDTIIELSPYSYQVIQGKKVEVPTLYQLSKDTLSFVFPQGYHKGYSLIIDPTVVFATYSGSQQNFYGLTTAVNRFGHIYTAGVLDANNFVPNLEKLGAFQSKYAGNVDIGIMRYDANGRSILSATYLGGTQVETPYSIQVNSLGQVVLLGATSSLDFPINPRSYQTAFNRGITVRTATGFAGNFRNGTDLTLTVFDENLSALVGSTFFGGTNNELLFDRTDALMYMVADNDRSEIVLDKQNNIYVVSTTYSTDIPTSPAAVQPSKSDGADVLVACFNPDVSQLRWATYLGGNSTDVGYAIRLFPDETKLLVAGSTRSTNFPTTNESLHRTFRGGIADGFAAILSTDGQKLLYATFIGTSRYDKVYHADIEPTTKDIILMGFSDSTYHATTNASFNRQGKIFFHRLDSSISQTRWTTRLGRNVTSSQPDFTPASVKFAPCNRIHFSGWYANVVGFGAVSMANLPLTSNAIKSTTDNRDFYFGSISGDAKTLIFATYLGGNASPTEVGDHAHGGTSYYDSVGTFYPATCNCGSQFPILAEYNALKSTLTNACDVLVMKFDFSTVRARFGTNFKRSCLPANLQLLDSGSIGTRFDWIIRTDTFQNASRSFIYPITQPGVYPITLKVSDSNDDCLVAYAYDTVQVGNSLQDFLPENTAIIGEQYFCGDKQVPFSVPLSTRQYQLSWYAASNPGMRISADSLVFYTINKPDTILLTVRNPQIVCDSITLALPVFYRTDELPNFTLRVEDNCIGQLPIIKVEPLQQLKSQSYQIFWGNGDSSLVIPESFNYSDTGNYLITLITNPDNHCRKSFSLPITIERVLPPNAFSPDGDGINDSFQIPTKRQGWQLTILNRWGKPIYQSNNYLSDWKAEDINAGTYLYLLKTPEGQTCKGTITVLK